MKICVRTLILCCTYYLEFGVFRTIPLALFLHSALARAIVDFLSVFQDSASPVFGYSMLCGRCSVLCFVGDFRLCHILFDSTTREFHLLFPLLSLLQKTAFFISGYISGPVLIHPVIGGQHRVY